MTTKNPLPLTEWTEVELQNQSLLSRHELAHAERQWTLAQQKLAELTEMIEYLRWKAEITKNELHRRFPTSEVTA